jgi:hypothetical protein
MHRSSGISREFHGSGFFRAIQPYQTPDAMKTRLHPAVNQIRNGDGLGMVRGALHGI